MTLLTELKSHISFNRTISVLETTHSPAPTACPEPSRRACPELRRRACPELRRRACSEPSRRVCPELRRRKLFNDLIKRKPDPATAVIMGYGSTDHFFPCFLKVDSRIAEILFEGRQKWRHSSAMKGSGDVWSSRVCCSALKGRSGNVGPGRFGPHSFFVHDFACFCVNIDETHRNSFGVKRK